MSKLLSPLNLSNEPKQVFETSFTNANRSPPPRLTSGHLVQIRFKLDPDSGLITVAGQLDREKQDQYLLLAEARDSSGGPGSNYTKIMISVMGKCAKEEQKC